MLCDYTDKLKAQEYLAANGWDTEAAVTDFFAEQDEALHEARSDARQGEPASEDRTLQGSPGPSSGTPQSGRRAAPRGGVATLADYTAGGGHSDDEDDDDTVNQDFFAGGEKSGLAVQNPDDLKRKIIEKAKR